jgi:hypothetical protein
MKLTILFVVVISAILVWWLRSVKPKRNLIPPSCLRPLALTPSHHRSAASPRWLQSAAPQSC